MTTQQLDNWFCSLNVKRKEHIAAKVLQKEGKDVHGALYPNCTNIWLPLATETKQWIYEHCTDHHGMWIQEGGDAPIYSY